MNIDYDNNKLAEIIKSLILSASQGQTGNLEMSKGDTDILLSKSFDPKFLSNTNFYEYYDNFKNSIAEALNQNIMTQGKGVKYNQIITEYNKLVRFIISQLNYNSLSNYEKDIINNEMKNLIDDVDAVKAITKNSGATEMFYYTLENIINDLSDNTYNIIKVELKKTLDNQKRQLAEYETKLEAEIINYDILPNSATKKKITDLYKKYSTLYKKIGKLFTKVERKAFKINDDRFLNKIEEITGVNEREDLRKLGEAITQLGSVMGDSRLPAPPVNTILKLEQLVDFGRGMINRGAVNLVKEDVEYIYTLFSLINAETFNKLKSNLSTSKKFIFDTLQNSPIKNKYMEKLQEVIDRFGEIAPMEAIAEEEDVGKEDEGELEGEGMPHNVSKKKTRKQVKKVSGMPHNVSNLADKVRLGMPHNVSNLADKVRLGKMVKSKILNPVLRQLLKAK
jgi:hypothetical protein